MRLVRFTPDEKQDRPCPGAIHQDGDLWTVPDDEAVEISAEYMTGNAAREAVPCRDDLDPTHPYRDFRFLKAGVAGSCDHVVGENGAIYPCPNEEELAAMVSRGIVKKSIAAEPVIR